MQSRRDRIEIIRSILELCKRDGAVKTKIVQRANLNSNTIKPYLAYLVEGGYLETLDGQRAVYRTTKRGEETLEMLREIDVSML